MSGAKRRYSVGDIAHSYRGDWSGRVVEIHKLTGWPMVLLPGQCAASLCDPRGLTFERPADADDRPIQAGDVVKSGAGFVAVAMEAAAGSTPIPVEIGNGDTVTITRRVEMADDYGDPKADPIGTVRVDVSDPSRRPGFFVRIKDEVWPWCGPNDRKHEAMRRCPVIGKLPEAPKRIDSPETDPVGTRRLGPDGKVEAARLSRDDSQFPWLLLCCDGSTDAASDQWVRGWRKGTPVPGSEAARLAEVSMDPKDDPPGTVRMHGETDTFEKRTDGLWERLNSGDKGAVESRAMIGHRVIFRPAP